MTVNGSITHNGLKIVKIAHRLREFVMNGISPKTSTIAPAHSERHVQNLRHNWTPSIGWLSVSIFDPSSEGAGMDTPSSEGVAKYNANLGCGYVIWVSSR